VPLSQSETLFGQFLLERALLAAPLLERAREVSRKTRDPLVRSLSKLGFVPDGPLADAVAEFSCLPRLRSMLRHCAEPLGLAPQFLQSHGLVPLARCGEELSVACTNPLDSQGLAGIEFATQLKVVAHVATVGEIDTLLRTLEADIAPPAQVVGHELEALADLASDAPAIRWVQRVLTQAVDRRASDIHVEPADGELKVRFRLDGVLHDIESLPSSQASPLVSRIKVLARLNIAEKRLPQDGRLRLTINGKGIDFRVATAPTLHGESVVLRILDREEVELDFTRLGFDPESAAILRAALAKPYGVVLSTGPTGSGETTTLYTA